MFDLVLAVLGEDLEGGAVEADGPALLVLGGDLAVVLVEVRVVRLASGRRGCAGDPPVGLDAVTPCGQEASQNLRDGVVLDWGRPIRRMLWLFSPNRGQRLSRFRRLAFLHPHFLNGSPFTCGRAFPYCCDDGPPALKQARREEVEQVNGRSGGIPLLSS